MSSARRDPRGDLRPDRRAQDQRHQDDREHRHAHFGRAEAVDEPSAEAEADDHHGGVDHAAADPLRDAGDLGVQRPGEHGGRDETGAQRQRDRSQPDELAGCEVDERGREEEGERVGDQDEDEQVAAGDLRHVGVGRDQRGGRRGGDQEEAEAERVVEPDGERDEGQGQRGEREVQAEQRQPGAQLDRLLAPRQRPDGQQRLEAESRDGERARRARRREGGAEPEADEDGRDKDEGGAEDPPLGAVHRQYRSSRSTRLRSSSPAR